MTEPNHQELLTKTLRGTQWVFYWRLATRLMGLGSTLMLIRLLAPADFGLVALASTIANSVEQFGWLGVENAIIREKDPGRDVYDTGFTINAIRSLVTAAIVGVAAFPAADFFAEPRLSYVLLALAASTAFAGLENIGVVEFRRTFAFDKEFVYLFVPRLISIILAVAAAAVFHSYWALVVGIISSRALKILFSYAMHPYRPRLSLSAWRVLAGYSFLTWVLGIVALVRERSDTVVIGRMMTSVQVGIYSIAFDLAALATQEINEPLQRAAYSGFAAARSNGIPLREPLLRLLGTVCLFSLPATMGLSLVADPFVKLVVGLKWTEATPLIEILGATGVTIVAGHTCRTLLNTAGNLGETIAMTLVFGLLRVGLMVYGVDRFGLPGAAMAAGIAIALEGVAYLVLTCVKLRIGARQMLGSMWRPILGVTVMALVMWTLGLGWQRTPDTSPVALARDLAVQVTAGALIYVTAVAAAWFASGRPSGAEADAVAMARKLLGKLRRRLPA